jgi:hypothetical protein
VAGFSFAHNKCASTSTRSVLKIQIERLPGWIGEYCSRDLDWLNGGVLANPGKKTPSVKCVPRSQPSGTAWSAPMGG